MCSFSEVSPQFRDAECAALTKHQHVYDRIRVTEAFKMLAEPNPAKASNTGYFSSYTTQATQRLYSNATSNGVSWYHDELLPLPRSGSSLNVCLLRSLPGTPTVFCCRASSRADRCAMLSSWLFQTMFVSAGRARMRLIVSLRQVSIYRYRVCRPICIPNLDVPSTIVLSPDTQNILTASDA